MKPFFKQKLFRKNNKLSAVFFFIAFGCLCAGTGIYFWMNPTPTPIKIIPKSLPQLSVIEPETLPLENPEEQEEESLLDQIQDFSDLTEIFKIQETIEKRPKTPKPLSPSWKKACQQWHAVKKKKKISIVIQNTEKISDKSWHWLSKIQIPLTFVVKDPSPKILKKTSKKEWELLGVLSLNKKLSSPKIKGYANTLRTTLWKDKDTLNKTFNRLSAENSCLLDNLQAPPIIQGIASIHSLPYLKSDSFLRSSRQATQALQKIEKTFSATDFVVISINPNPAILKNLTTWISRIKKQKKIAFVPISVLFAGQKECIKGSLISPSKISPYQLGFQ